MTKKIAVLGAGANGASIGADVTRAGHDVVLIDQWPEHVQAMRQGGVRIEMPGEVIEQKVRAYNLCDVCTFTEQFDIVLLVMKAYDTKWATQLIEPYLKSDGLVAGVQNGMTVDDIADVVIDQNARLIAEQSVMQLLGSIAAPTPFLPRTHIEPRLIFKENIPAQALQAG